MRTPTLTKDEVDYRVGTKAEHCGICIMFTPLFSQKGKDPTGRCDRVIGRIGSDMDCDLFELRKGKSAS